MAKHLPYIHITRSLAPKKKKRGGGEGPIPWIVACEGLVWKNGTMLNDKQMVALG